MNEMVESVMLLCPDYDREDIENDLNLTGDVERTINRALDGMLTPRKVSQRSSSESIPVIIMDDDDCSVLKYTNIKEKNNANMTSQSLDNHAVTSIGIISNSTNNSTHTCLEIIDSDTEKDEPKANYGRKYETFKSSVKSVVSHTEHSDSDNESLPPAFGDNECKSISSKVTSSYVNKEICQTHVQETSNILSTTASKDDNISKLMGVKDVDVVKYGTCSDQDCGLEEPAVKKRKKRTKEEIEEQKKISLLKRKAKENERLEKQEEKRKQKEAKAAEMKQKKMQVEKDRLQKKAEKLTQSALNLGSCIKFVTICLDPSFFNGEVSDLTQNILVQKLCSMEVSYKIQPQPHPGSITWQRISVQHSVQGEDMTISSSNSYSDENEVLIVLQMEQFAEMVYTFKQEYQVSDGVTDERQNESETLVEFTKNIKDLYHGKRITFLLAGLEKYMRNVKTKQQRAFRDAATGSSEENEGNRKRRKKKLAATVNVTRTDIEEALVDLQIKTNVCVYPCETEEDIATKLALFTKAVAERPYKKSLTDGFGFGLDKLDKTALKVSKDGQGLILVWQQQIEQFRNVSRDMATAIVAVYPSPQLLLNAYEQCMSEREALFLLEDILVRRGGGSLATSRRIGPELSKRFYILFHSKDSGELMKR